MKKIYMAVTADKYELPLCVEEDVKSLAKKCETTRNSILSSISHKRGGKHSNIKYIRIEVEEDDEE